MTVYREPSEADVYVPATPREPSLWPWRFGWALRVLLIAQGLPVAGVLHDVCTPQHQGLCWAFAVLALMGSVIGIPIAVDLPPTKPTKGAST